MQYDYSEEKVKTTLIRFRKRVYSIILLAGLIYLVYFVMMWICWAIG